MVRWYPVPGRPTNFDKSKTMAYYACRRCGWGLFGHFSLIYHFSFLSLSLWETARYRLKFCPNKPIMFVRAEVDCTIIGISLDL